MLVLLLLCLAAVFGRGLAAPNCNFQSAGNVPFPKPYTNGGYKATVRAVIANKNFTLDATEYTDVKGYGATTLVIAQNGVSTTIIVHYLTNEIFYISPVVDGLSSPSRTCVASTLTPTNSSLLFNVVPDNSTGLPHLFSVDMLYNIASTSKVTYIGSEVIDGTKVNHWATCVNWPQMKVSFALHYYFTVPGWLAPSGLQQVPVLVNVTGTHTYPNQTTYSFNHIYQYVDFENYDNDPKEIFATPAGIYCLLRQHLKALPGLSDAFYYREELSNIQFQSITEYDIWYDYEFLLLRYDSRITPTTNTLLFTDDGPFTVIHDYNTGVQYAIDRGSSQCDIGPIPPDSMGVDAVGSATQDTLSLRSPLSFFNLQNDSLYAGQRKARGVMCDVFQTVLTNFSGMPVSLYEVYFPSGVIMSSDVGHGSASASTSSPMRINVWDSAGQRDFEYNIFDFAEDHFLYYAYDISLCYPDETSSINFQITFSVETTTILALAQDTILRALHDTIASNINISPLRLQNTRLHWNDQYLYFLAQLLDKAPPIAKYIKHSSQIMASHNSKNLQGIASIQDCATQCDGLTEWLCTSFDYCGNSQICTLGRPYKGSIPLTNNSNCDHFSRVVGGGSNKEYPLSNAWSSLKNLVYHTGLSITIPINTAATNLAPGSSPGVSDQVQRLHIKATSITDQIYAGSRVLTSADAMKQFIGIPNREAKGYDEQAQGVSVDDCAANCASELTFSCQSFAYCYETGTCLMSQQHPDEDPTLLKISSTCDLYYRDYSSMYEQIPGVTLKSSSDTIYQFILTPNQCAKLCTFYAGFHCQSFDYCSDINTCFLGRTHFLDAPPDGVEQSTDCNHYSRNYLDDFTAIQNTQVQLTQNRIIEAVTPQQCAKLCSEELTFTCNTFDYCVNQTWCRLFGASMTSVGQVTTADKAFCTVYKRQYSEALPSAVKVQVVHAKSTDKSKNYSGGSMAGLGISMIVIGILIGAGVIYFVIRRRSGENDMNVTFTKQGDKLDS